MTMTAGHHAPESASYDGPVTAGVGCSSRASSEEIIALCKTKLGSVKAPKSVDFWESLPRSPVGKVRKKDIRETFWKGRTRAI